MSSWPSALRRFAEAGRHGAEVGGGVEHLVVVGEGAGDGGGFGQAQALEALGGAELDFLGGGVQGCGVDLAGPVGLDGLLEFAAAADARVAQDRGSRERSGVGGVLCQSWEVLSVGGVVRREVVLSWRGQLASWRRLAVCRLPLCRLPRCGRGSASLSSTSRARGVLIERVEVDAGGTGVQGRVGQVNGGADPDPGPFGVGIGGREAFDQFRVPVRRRSVRRAGRAGGGW